MSPPASIIPSSPLSENMKICVLSYSCMTLWQCPTNFFPPHTKYPLWKLCSPSCSTVYPLPQSHLPSLSLPPITLHLQFQVTYSCLEEGKSVNHSLLVRFHVNDLLDKTEVDVSEENMVVVVTKSESCQREWAWFEAGPNSQSTEVQYIEYQWFQ